MCVQLYKKKEKKKKKKKKNNLTGQHLLSTAAFNHLGVMVSVLDLSTADRGFEPRSGQVNIVKLVCVASPLNTKHYGERAKTGCLGIRIMCPNMSPRRLLFQLASTITIQLHVLV